MTLRRLLLAALLALALPPYALGGDVPDTSWAPPGARATPYTDLNLPGWELYKVSKPPRVWGAARVGGATVQGPLAFRRAVSTTGREDPLVLARLAALFLDPNGAGQAVWTAPTGTRAADQQAVATPPVLDGDAVVYWRFHHQTADMVRVRVDLTQLAVSTESGRAVLDAADPRDPITRARDEIVAEDLPTVRKGIARLVAHGEPPALLIVLDLAANHQAAVVREAAVAALADVRPEGGVAVVTGRLLGDPDDKVRVAAARTLERWSDPASRSALEAASAADASPVVREIARAALAGLP